MEQFWKGAIAPWTKHVDSVEFVPLLEMTDVDWAVLDFEMLDDLPRERIISQAMLGRLAGFYAIYIDQHKEDDQFLVAHGGKPKYLWPGEIDDEDEASEFDWPGAEDERQEQLEDYYESYDNDEYDDVVFELTFNPLARDRRARAAGLKRKQLESWPTWAIILAIIAFEKLNDAWVGEEVEESQGGASAEG